MTGILKHGKQEDFFIQKMLISLLNDEGWAMSKPNDTSVKKQTSQRELAAESDLISLLPESAFSHFPPPLSFSSVTTLYLFFSSFASHSIMKGIYSQNTAFN